MNGLHIPLVYVLACDKRQTTYELIIQKLLKTDAVTKLFPDASVHGCFFHFGQNLWRHIQSLGLQSAYQKDSMFAMNLKYLLALASVPEGKVVDAFNLISEQKFFEDDEKKQFNTEIQNLLSYFETTYIGTPLRGTQSRRKTALFPIILWNMFKVTKAGDTKLFFQFIELVL